MTDIYGTDLWTNSVISRSDGIVLREIGDVSFLVPAIRIDGLQNNRIFLVNPVGLFIWKNIDGRRNFKELMDLIKSNFKIDDVKNVEEDIKEFIIQLKQLGFLFTEKVD